MGFGAKCDIFFFFPPPARARRGRDGFEKAVLWVFFPLLAGVEETDGEAQQTRVA